MMYMENMESLKARARLDYTSLFYSIGEEKIDDKHGLSRLILRRVSGIIS